MSAAEIAANGPATPTAAVGQGLLSSFVAVMLALACGAVLIAGWGVNPLTAYGALVSGAFGNWNSLAETLLRAIPLIFTGLAVALAFRGGSFNVGAEGQLILGAAAAAWVGLAVHGLPAPALIVLMMLAAIVAGALWSLLAGSLKLKFGASELITTIMLNYVAIEFDSYLLHGPLQEAARYLPQTERLPALANLPTLIPRTRLNIGFVIAVIAALLAQFALWRTVWGFRLRVTGLNARAALNAGINVTGMTIWAFGVSGALAGLAGYMEVVGVQHRMIENLSPGYGYTGIIVALLGQTSPLGVLSSAILFAALQVGATTMEAAAGVPSTLATIIQGLVVLFVIARSSVNPLRRRGG
jgi:general nucleoside transport system permease protein